MTDNRVIHQGAEAVLSVDGKGALYKDRISKGYRIPEIDRSVRRQRTKLEARLLERARRSGINAPNATAENEHLIKMDHIEGLRVKDALTKEDADIDTISEKIGEIAVKLHDNDIIHGDLTTSNMVLCSKDNEIYIIDFGLGKVSHKVEDKATDLFLLHEALRSTHYRISDRIWKTIINIYVQKYSNASAVITRLQGIEKRRRYK